MKYEIIMWVNHFLKAIPGNLGCFVRNLMLPYKNGKNVQVYDGVHIDKPSLLSIGDNVSINRGSVINAGGGVSIGSSVLIGPGVIIYSQNHVYSNSALKIADQGYVLKKTVIGDNVWIAARAIILPGVVVGNDVVIAAGAVVTKDVPSNSLVAGNPAKFVKRLYENK
ncbi:acyltransferase [Rheinheimera sp.]|uniref:acyltransferase n=1 Tax=Rheinheimera sp. TaxID=1869214 RepID=UPI003AF644D0